MPSEKQIMAVVGIGLFAVIAAFAYPVLMDSSTERTTSIIDVQENGSETLTDGLELTVDSISNLSDGPANDTATIVYNDTELLNSTQHTLNETETGNVTLSGETITTELVELRNGSETDIARLRVIYPRTWGYSSGAEGIVSNLPILFAIAMAVILLVLLFKVIP
jgi:hypothetical protein